MAFATCSGGFNPPSCFCTGGFTPPRSCSDPHYPFGSSRPAQDAPPFSAASFFGHSESRLPRAESRGAQPCTAWCRAQPAKALATARRNRGARNLGACSSGGSRGGGRLSLPSAATPASWSPSWLLKSVRGCHSERSDRRFRPCRKESLSLLSF